MIIKKQPFNFFSGFMISACYQKLFFLGLLSQMVLFLMTKQHTSASCYITLIGTSNAYYLFYEW